jgi:site-specific DNA recombinase
MPRIALYLRQSKDTEGDGFAIDRQRDNCLSRATGKGWIVDDAAIYVDNNTSASSLKVRPAYQRLIADVKARKFDVVIAWNLDRLTRRPREIEDWIDLNQRYGVNLMTSEGSDPIDMSTESGRLVLRINAAVARQEVERKGRRQKESNAQARTLGLPPTGRRSFGYSPLAASAKSITATRIGADGKSYPAYGHEPIPAEADAIRRGYDLLLSGASLHAIAKTWNAAGLTTTAKGQWTQNTVRGALTNPRYTGLVGTPREAGVTGHRSNRYDLSGLTPGTWEPIVALETWTAASEILRDPSRRKTSGAPRRWLLSGLATCGVLVDGVVCGAPMKAGATHEKVSIYRCSASNHLARKADVADEVVVHDVLARLARADAADLLDNREAPDRDALQGELRALQARLGNVADLVADGTLSKDQARASVGRLRGQVADLTGRLTDAGKVDTLGPLIFADDIREAWNGLVVDVQRAVIASLYRVEFRTPGKGTRPPKDDEGRRDHTRRSVTLTPR